jgi:putative ABC transport system permease protein
MTATALSSLPKVTMMTTTVAGLRRSRSRFLLSALAVLLSVSFFAAVLLLSNGLRGTAGRDIAQANAGIDVVLRGRELGAARNAGPVQIALRGTVPLGAVTTARSVAGVRAAHGVVSVGATVATTNGKILDTGTLGVRAENWLPDDELRSHRIIAGRPPAAANEVVVERSIADHGDLNLGDRLTISTDSSTIKATITGIADYASVAGSPLHGTVFVNDKLAMKLLGANGYERVAISATSPETSEGLAAKVGAALATQKLTGVEAIDGRTFTVAEQDEATSRTSFQSTFLTFFALVALLAGTTIIYNTFVIAVQQRTREIAMLRAIGASRRQVLRSVLVEAAIVGVVASVAGAIGGVLLFKAMGAIFEAIGLTFLSTSGTIDVGSVALSVIVGIVVTVVSAAIPARRAASISPMAALREQSVDTSAQARTRSFFAYALFAMTAVLGVVSWAQGSGAIAGIAVLFGFLGTIVGGPILIRATTLSFGRLLARFGGTTGSMATTNLQRNPKRSASTSFSLSLGMALIVMFSAIASSLSGGIANDVDKGLRADHVVVPAASTGPAVPRAVPRSVVESVSAVPGVKRAATLSTTFAAVNGTSATVAVVDPKEFDATYDLAPTGQPLSALSATSVAVDSSTDYRLGDELTLVFSSGKTARFTVTTMLNRLLPGSPDSPLVLISGDAAAAAGATTTVSAAFVITDGKSTTLASADTVVKANGALRFLSSSEYVDSLGSATDTFRNFVYSLLAVALLISIVGIANTTILSINERRREIGVLRAIGTTARQVRRIIRLEALLLAVHASVLGIALGIGAAAAAFTLVASDQGFALTIPWRSIIVIGIGGAIAGIVASLWPAWKGSRAEVLASIASD